MARRTSAALLKAEIDVFLELLQLVLQLMVFELHLLDFPRHLTDLILEPFDPHQQARIVHATALRGISAAGRRITAVAIILKSPPPPTLSGGAP